MFKLSKQDSILKGLRRGLFLGLTAPMPRVRCLHLVWSLCKALNMTERCEHSMSRYLQGAEVKCALYAGQARQM